LGYVPFCFLILYGKLIFCILLCQSANADTAIQVDTKIVAKAGIKHTVEATADDTEGTSKVEEPGAECKRASESADYGASQLHELSQVSYFTSV
jgi:hypothetical protein